MTTHPRQQSRLTTVDSQNGVRMEVRGDLDYTNADRLVQEATAQLADRHDLADLHLRCADLGVIDSVGLSALLMIVRRTTAAGVRLHLDDRPAHLDRLLDLTGTLAHLTAAPPAKPPHTTESDSPAHPSPTAGQNGNT